EGHMTVEHVVDVAHRRHHDTPKMRAGSDHPGPDKTVIIQHNPDDARRSEAGLTGSLLSNGSRRSHRAGGWCGRLPGCKEPVIPPASSSLTPRRTAATWYPTARCTPFSPTTGERCSPTSCSLTCSPRAVDAPRCRPTWSPR